MVSSTVQTIGSPLILKEILTNMGSQFFKIFLLKPKKLDYLHV